MSSRLMARPHHIEGGRGGASGGGGERAALARSTWKKDQPASCRSAPTSGSLETTERAPSFGFAPSSELSAMPEAPPSRGGETSFLAASSRRYQRAPRTGRCPP